MASACGSQQRMTSSLGVILNQWVLPESEANNCNSRFIDSTYRSPGPTAPEASRSRLRNCNDGIISPNLYICIYAKLGKSPGMQPFSIWITDILSLKSYVQYIINIQDYT